MQLSAKNHVRVPIHAFSRQKTVELTDGQSYEDVINKTKIYRGYYIFLTMVLLPHFRRAELLEKTIDGGCRLSLSSTDYHLFMNRIIEQGLVVFYGLRYFFFIRAEALGPLVWKPIKAIRRLNRNRCFNFAGWKSLIFNWCLCRKASRKKPSIADYNLPSFRNVDLSRRALS